MGQWVVTVAGIAILSVLCDVILPEGQTRKYIKTVFGVVVTLVIIQPMIGLFNGNINLPWSASNSTSVIQDQYIENVENRQKQITVNTIKSVLDANNISVDGITVSETNNSVTVQLGVKYSKQFESKVREVVSKYFTAYEIITVWK